MKARYIAVLGLIAVFVLAGCVGGGSQQESSAREKGVVISDMVISRTDIKWGETTRINLLFENKNKAEVRNLRATLIDTGPLEVVGNRRCTRSRIRGANNLENGPRRQCIWTLKCGEDCRSISEQREKDFSVTPIIKYTYVTQVLGEGDAISVEFQDPEDFDSGRISQKRFSIGNGDVELSVDYSSPQSANTRSLEFDYNLRNTGGGDLLTPVDFRYSGSFLRNRVFSKRSIEECGKMGIPEGQSSQETECVMGLQRLQSETVYTLRIKGAYEYSKQREVDLSILPSEGEGPLPDYDAIVRRKRGISRDRLPSGRRDCFDFCLGQGLDSLGKSACLGICGNR